MAKIYRTQNRLQGHPVVKMMHKCIMVKVGEDKETKKNENSGEIYKKN